MKKPYFSGLLAKNIAIFLSVGLVFGSVGTFVANYLHCKHRYEISAVLTNQLSRINERAYTWGEGYSERVGGEQDPNCVSELFDYWLLRMRFESHLCATGTMMDMGLDEDELYNSHVLAVLDENYEDSYDFLDREYVFVELTRKQESEEQNIARLYDSPVNEDWREVLSVFNQYWDKYYASWLKGDKGKPEPVVICDDIYIRGIECYPGSLRIMNKATGEVLYEKDLTPENKDDYTHILLQEEEWEQHFILGIQERNQAAVNNIKNGTLKNIRKSDGERLIYYADHSALYSDQVQFKETSLPDGREVVLAFGAHYSIFDAYGKTVFLIYVFLFLGCLLSALLATYVRYIRQKAIYEKEQYRRNLMDTMAHDLKTPLMAVSGYAENLQENVAPEKNERYLSAIRENVGQMNDMISDILELSKVEEPHKNLVMQEVDLYPVTMEILDKYKGLYEARGIKVEVNGGRGVFTANQVYMSRVLENLIGNAIKYCDESGNIKIDLSEKEYMIRNTFSGTLDVPVEKLTEAFVKGQNSRTRTDTDGRGGTGVGLALVKTMLDVQGLALTLQVADGWFAAKIL